MGYEYKHKYGCVEGTDKLEILPHDKGIELKMRNNNLGMKLAVVIGQEDLYNLTSVVRKYNKDAQAHDRKRIRSDNMALAFWIALSLLFIWLKFF